MLKRLRVFGVYLALTTSLSPLPAHATGVELVLAISTALNAVGVSVAAQAVIGQALLAGFSALGGTIGSLLISAALSFASNLLFQPDRPTVKPQATYGNLKEAEGERFWMAGEQRKGGQVMFASDRSGYITKLVAHADAEATSEIGLMFNNTRVTVGGDGIVDSPLPFGDGGGSAAFKITTRAGTVSQAAMSELVSEFTEWTTSHVGAGVADTLMRVDPLAPADRSKVLISPGALGLGEPDIDRIAMWGRCYDPRDVAQDVDDPSTWGPDTGNPALTIARHRIDPERFANSPSSIDWDNIAEQADICDEEVTDRYSITKPRYRIGITVNKAKENNIDAENRMLAFCDGIRRKNSEGKFGIFVGKYVEPTLILRDEDIFDIESEESEDGESLATHYFPSYTEPEFDYKEQTGAPFIVPSWTTGSRIKSQNLPLYGILWHNQAFRVCKAATLRQIEKRRLAILCNLRGLRAREHRFLRLDLSDAALSGVYEIASSSVLHDGMSCQIVLIKADPDRWDLLPGEEGARPEQDTEITTDQNDPITNVAPADMTINPRSITGSGGNSVQFIATFVRPTRTDYRVQIQLRKKATPVNAWEDFNVDTPAEFGVSGVASDGAVYEFQWRVVTSKQVASVWSSIVEVTAVADDTPPADLSGVAVSSPATGEILYEFTTSNSTNYVATDLYYGLTNVFADATAATPANGEIGPPNTAESFTKTGLSTDDYFTWLQPKNGSSVTGTLSGPHTVTVT